MLVAWEEVVRAQAWVQTVDGTVYQVRDWGTNEGCLNNSSNWIPLVL